MRKISEYGENKIFWYKDDNNVYELDCLHIKFIIDHPSIFDLTEDYIEEIYSSYNEPIGTEGMARETILNKVMKNGWIRIRYNPTRDNTWFIEVDSFFNRKRNIKNCISYFYVSLMKMTLKDNIEVWDKKDIQYKGKVENILSRLISEVKNETKNSNA